MKKQDGKHGKAVSGILSCFQGLQLFLVQSIVCLAVIAIAFLLQTMGGGAFLELATRFQTAMVAYPLVSLSNNPADEANQSTHTTNAAATTQATVQAAQSASVGSMTVCPPLTGGVITSPYGEREDPITASTAALHEGVDIAAAEGTSLAALMSGTVIDVGYEENGYGHHIIVECAGGYQYLYAHCSQITAAIGDAVTAGETIAFVGNTGRSTGSHLHFEWRENGEPLDPMTVLPEKTYA